MTIKEAVSFKTFLLGLIELDPLHLVKLIGLCLVFINLLNFYLKVIRFLISFELIRVLFILFLFLIFPWLFWGFGPTIISQLRNVGSQARVLQPWIRILIEFHLTLLRHQFLDLLLQILNLIFQVLLDLVVFLNRKLL